MRDIGPLDRSPSAHEADARDFNQFRIANRDDEEDHKSDGTSSDYDADEVQEYKPSSQRRGTGTFGSALDRNSADHTGSSHLSQQQQQQESAENPRNVRGLSLPLRPQPAATTPQDGYTARQGEPTSPFLASPRAMGPPSPYTAANPFSPHVQQYDPHSSPSMVQPFSPRVTASGSVKSPMLKPALSHRNDSFGRPLNGSGDSLERGTAHLSEAQSISDAYRTRGDQPPAKAGVAKTLVGLYGAFNGSNAPIKGPAFRVHKDDSDEGTIVEQEGALYDKSKMGGQDISPSSSYAPPASGQPAGPPGGGVRRDSFWNMGDEEAMDDMDPRLTGIMRKSMQVKRDKLQQFDHRRSSWSSETGDPTIKRPKNTRRVSLGNFKLEFGDEDDNDKYTATRRKSYDRRKSATTITCHISHVQQRQKFILKLSKALMMFGAPSHRVESQLNATAAVLEVDAQFVHFPGIVIAAFGDIDNHTSETHFVKSSGSLSLGPLHEVHVIYRRVVHDECSVEEGSNELTKLIKAKPCYGVWTRIMIAGGLCFIIAPLSFGGSFVDAWVSACFGILLMFLNLRVAKNNAMYSNIFEISVAILISFISRGLSTSGVFCYQAIASSGVVLVLPGYVILCGSLELASKNLIAGSVRMVYAIIYSLFLGFGIAIGSDLYFLLDPAARQSMYVPLTQATQISGSFTMTNETMPMWNGTFSFTNATSESQGNALKTGTINCEREIGDPWWKANISAWFNFLWVPAFSLLLCMHNLQHWKSREIIVMIIIACVGFACNMLANHFIFSRSDVVSTIGSFVIGILGNVYSRVFRGTAFTAMAVAVLFLVPSGMSAAGGLAMTYKGSDGDLYSNGLSIGFRMVSVAIGITVGLFGSGLVVYSFGRKKGAALFAF